MIGHSPSSIHRLQRLECVAERYIGRQARERCERQLVWKSNRLGHARKPVSRTAWLTLLAQVGLVELQREGRPKQIVAVSQSAFERTHIVAERKAQGLE